MHLSRDLLDNQVYDKFNRRLGKVDEVVLVLRRGRPPRVAAIELGLAPLMTRVSARLGAFAARLERALGVGDGTSVRIGMDRVQRIGIDVHVDVDGNRTDAYAWERWVRRVFIGHIPGAGSGGPEAERK